MKAFARTLPLFAALAFSFEASAACTPTGFFRDAINMTAAYINPPTVTGDVDATGCNIGVYYDAGHAGSVSHADVHGANYFGVLVNGDGGPVHVDIKDSTIRNIGEVPHNGTQHGVGIYYRAFFAGGSATGEISDNDVHGYQKGGIVANGAGTNVKIEDNTVTGDGHVTFIAMNGIQVGYGAMASLEGNTVSGNSYIGFPGDGSASGGILVVGGPGYGTCPDGNPCPYTVGTKIEANRLVNNDVGIYISNLDVNYTDPTTKTGIKVEGNKISNDSCFNTSYQAAISAVGLGDRFEGNKINVQVCAGVYNPNGIAVDLSAGDQSGYKAPDEHSSHHSHDSKED